MMATHTNADVWLQTMVNASRTITSAYVRNPVDKSFEYIIAVKKQSKAGHSDIRQQGKVDAKSGQPTALSGFSTQLKQNEQCRIELTLTAGGKKVGHYRFACPPQWHSTWQDKGIFYQAPEE